MDPLQDALDIQELEQSAGWHILAEELTEAIRVKEEERKEIQGTNPNEIGTKYIALSNEITGLKKAFEIIHDIKSRKPTQ